MVRAEIVFQPIRICYTPLLLLPTSAKIRKQQYINVD